MKELSQKEKDSLTAYFTYVDADRDGFISAEEIQDAGNVDLNGDGVITEDEDLMMGQKFFADIFEYDINRDKLISLEELYLYFRNRKSQHEI